jgi:hypothetical protein
MCVCASSKYGLNRGLCLNVYSTAVIVGDCHGRPDSETLKTHSINHALRRILEGTRQSCAKNKKEPKFSLTPRVILTVFFKTEKKKGGPSCYFTIITGLTSFFAVPKGEEDIRMVYDGT